MNTMSLEKARAIVATAAKSARGLDRLGELADELARLDGYGNVTSAEEVIRTIDNLAGHYDEGKFVGARTIVAALRLCRAWPVDRNPADAPRDIWNEERRAAIMRRAGERKPL